MKTRHLYPALALLLPAAGCGTRPSGKPADASGQSATAVFEASPDRRPAPGLKLADRQECSDAALRIDSLTTLRYKGPSNEGFAAEYAGVFEVVRILAMEREHPARDLPQQEKTGVVVGRHPFSLAASGSRPPAPGISTAPSRWGSRTT